MTYVTLSMEELKRSYNAIQIYGYDSSVGYGHRVYFWVCGNGIRSILFSTSGELRVFRNDQFTVEKVLDAEKTMIVGGRVRYLPSEGEDWKDLGPIEPDGVKPSDPDMDDTREAFLVEPPTPSPPKQKGKKGGWLDNVGGW